MVPKQKAASDIESLSEQVARELLRAMPSLKDKNPFEKSMVILKALDEKQGGAARLRAAFHDDSSFGDLRDGWIQLNSFGLRIEGDTGPQFLISSVIDGRSARSAVEEMRAIARSQTSASESYSPLGGCTVAEAFSLDDNIDLIPWADVPDSHQKTAFSASHLPHEPTMSTHANSAVRIRLGNNKVLFSTSSDSEPVRKDRHSKEFIHWEIAEDVVRCITALGVWNVAVLGRWSR